MKKFLILIPLVLLVLWAGLTWIMGSLTQSGFTAAIEELNANLGAATAVTAVSEESYSRGFLSSEAVTKITTGKGAADGNTDIYLKFKAWHGPLMMTSEGMKLGTEYVLVTLNKDSLPDEIRSIVEEGFKGAEPVKLGLFTGFGGKVAVDAEIAPFSSSKPGPETIEFGGLTGEFQTDARTSFAIGKINIGPLTVEDKKAGKLLSIAAGESEMNYTNLVMRVTADGTSHIDFPEIKVTTDGNSYVLKDLHFDNVSKENEGKLDMTSRLSIGSFKGPEKGKYAEIFSRANGNLEMEFDAKGMEIETLKTMAEAQKKMQATQANDERNSEAAMEAVRNYMIAATALLQPGYQLNNHIAFTNKSGKSEIKLGLEYVGEKKLADLVTVRELVEALKVNLSLQIVKDLIPPALAEQIKPAMAMGFIVDKENAYKGDAILGGGELKLNGQPSPVLQNMSPLLDAPIPWEKIRGK